jgi:hypothetical protein
MSFDTWVDLTVESALVGSTSDFSELVSHLPGIYPLDVLRSLRSIAARGRRLVSKSRDLIESASQAPQIVTLPSMELGLPVPHPLDFEWRFASESINSILERCARMTPPTGTLALVGTPTVAASLRTTLSRRTEYFGIDADMLVSRGLLSHFSATHKVDLLREPQVTRSYATILMDPPWYPDYITRFIYFAARALAPNGHLLLAMAPRGTRPGIAEETRDTERWLEQNGFEILDILASSVAYETPPFERNSLRASGISNVGNAWRRGDLWILQKQGVGSASWPGDVVTNLWREFAFGPVRVRVDVGRRDSGSNASLRTIVEGDVLSTVSRRDPRRASASVWTSGNRVYGCESPLAFASILEAWSQSPRDMNVTDADRDDRNSFFAIVERERAELGWAGR